MPGKNIFLLIACCFSLIMEAQHTISGNLSPAEDFKWLIAYQLGPGHQNYIADSAVKEGKFSIKIPENAKTGIYRLVYAIPQDEFYFDVIYNGKEDVELSFSTEEGLSFLNSVENTLYNNYFAAVNELENKIIQFYSAPNTNPSVLSNIHKELDQLQKQYETKSEGLISGHFITANKPYIPSGHKNIETYVQQKKEHYFDALDFSDPVLQGSAFLTDKAVNYVFTALPYRKMSAEQLEKEMQANIARLAGILQPLDPNFKTALLGTIWSQLTENQYNSTADYVYNNYLETLAVETKDTELLNSIATYNRLRPGAQAPEISWNEGEETKKLSDLEEAKNYLIVFWSSTCSHCLQQLPELHQRIKGIPNVTVLAIGLEDDEQNWKMESAKLPGFIHGIALGKWESPYTTLYDIHQTPTYYILDKEKRIVAKPEDYKEAVALLKKNQ